MSITLNPKLAAEVISHINSSAFDDPMDLLTVLRRELLRSYVERVAPDDDLERERMYQRLKRQRTRVLRRLRSLLGQSPMLLASGF